MAHSMPLPGPSRPHVSRRAARSAGRSAALGLSVSGVAAPWGMTTTFDGVDVEARRSGGRGRSRSSRRRRRRRRRPARARSAGAAVGWRTTVWATTIDGTDERVEHGRARRRRRRRRRCRTRAGRWRRRRGRARRRRRRTRRRAVVERGQDQRVLHRRRGAAAAHDVDACRRWRPGRRRGRRRTWRCRRRSAGSWRGSRTIGRGRRRGGRRGRRGCGDARRAPDVGSVEASSLRRATKPLRPSSPSEATLPRRCAADPTRGRPASQPVTCGVPAHPTCVTTSASPLRIAVLAPIAWRTPPRHYGPWELFASLLTEGLVALGHDVTLFATADSVTAAALRGTSPAGWSEDDGDRAQGRRVPPHRRRVRARRRLRRHPQRLRLPAPDLQRSRRHAGRDHDPRLLVAAHRARLRALRRDDHVRRDQRRRPPPAPALRGDDPPRHRRRRVRRRTPTPGDHLLFFGRIHPDKGTAEAIEVAAARRAAARHRRHRPGRAVLPRRGRAPRRRRPGPLRRAGRRRRARRGARRRPRPAPPDRLRRAVRLQRRRGDGLRHAGDRLRPRLDGRAHRPTGRTGFLVDGDRRGGARPSTPPGRSTAGAIRAATVRAVRPGDDGRAVRRRVPRRAGRAGRAGPRPRHGVTRRRARRARPGRRGAPRRPGAGPTRSGRRART